MKEILLACIKHHFHWSSILTAIADAITQYGYDQKEKNNEFGFRFYADLAEELYLVRNKFNQREQERK